MNSRTNIAKVQPHAFTAMYKLEEYLKTTALSDTHKELIKIRASQVNGCAYCIDMHTRDARKYGETEQRIYLLNAWRETGFFTDEERCILAMTEEITLINNHGLTDETYEKAKQLFDDNHLAQIIMAITVINAWNRIAISTKMKPVSLT